MNERVRCMSEGTRPRLGRGRCLRPLRGLCAAALGVAAALSGWAQAGGGEAVADWVRGLRVGEPRTFAGLTVVPILPGAGAPGSAVATLEQGLAEGWLRIVEKDGGTFPTVLLSNLSDRTLFVMAGEILSGCKQDRIVARDLLVRPWRKNLPVPVYCVEEGRWHPQSGSFASEKNLGTFSLRAKAQAAAPQEEIWNQVAGENRKAGVDSQTGALQDAYRDERVEARLREADGVLGKLPRRFPTAVGAAVALGDSLVGVDLFASSELFGELWPKILRSAVLGLVGTPGPAALPPAKVGRLLQWIASSPGGWSRTRGLDLGEELLLSTDDWDVHALVEGERVLHIAAFPAPSSEQEVSPLLRPVPQGR